MRVKTLARCIVALFFPLMAGLAPATSAEIEIAGPPGSGFFGESILILPNGNIVVTDPGFDAPGPITDVGAVYLYDSATLTVISTLTGSHMGDRVGAEGVSMVGDGNFVVRSTSWNGSQGAVTWCRGTTGLGGVVSEANSLVGGKAYDTVGSYFNVLANGNYVVRSAQWDNGAVRDVGAVTWCHGNTGLAGVVSASNSLTGSSQEDRVGLGLVALSNGNYLVTTPFWNEWRGAVCWCSGSSGLTGQVSSLNALTGGRPSDGVGVENQITVLKNDCYLVASPLWDNGGAVDAGAVTWSVGTNGVKGVVSAANSLVGAKTNDRVGGDGIILLNNGNYVIQSPSWNAMRGAATWGSGISGITGEVSAANSLIGTSPDDYVGSTRGLPNGNYLVISSISNNGAATDAGSVTWGSGTLGVAGVVSTSNSLVGSTANNRVGYEVEILPNSNYVVRSSLWDKGPEADVGAVTWGSGSSGVQGVVSELNSLTGSLLNDRVGYRPLIILDNGNYLVCSPHWHYGAVADAGAVTWGGGISGVTGVVSSSNSLVSNSANTLLGYFNVHPLPGGNYVVGSPGWSGGKGAVTWGSGTAGVAGELSPAISLTGSVPGDYVGTVQVIAKGDYAVLSPKWGAARGAVSWGSGQSGVKGTVSMDNSLIGATPGDEVGTGVKALSNGSFVVTSPKWSNGSVTNAGAVTWCSDAGVLKGVVTGLNSLIGSSNDDMVGGDFPAIEVGDSNYVVGSPSWNGGMGAFTWGSGRSGVVGTVSRSNSLTGTLAGDQVGLYCGALTNGNFVVVSRNWNQWRGAVTWGHGGGGPVGAVSSANSLVGSTLDDGVGDYTQFLSNGNYIVSSPGWDNGIIASAGAVTWGNGLTGVTGLVSAANSLVGSSPGDTIGDWSRVTVFSNGNYLVRGVGWDNGDVADAGAVTLGDGKEGTRGVIDSSNSFVGQSPYGSDYITISSDPDGDRFVIKSLPDNRFSLLGYAPKIILRGNGVMVLNGSGVPGLINHTDFGSVAVAVGMVARQFTITNAGVFRLEMPGAPPVRLGGAAADDFKVTRQPGNSVTGGEVTSFEVAFDPSAPGPRVAEISIPDASGGILFQFQIRGTGQTILEAWRSNAFGDSLLNTDDLEDFDADGVVNLLEFAAGTDPATAASGPGPLKLGILPTGGDSAPGQPVMAFEDGKFVALFARRRDFATAGLDVIPQFSADLAAWEDSVTPPQVRSQSDLFEIVSIPCPLWINETTACYFRVKAVVAP